MMNGDVSFGTSDLRWHLPLPSLFRLHGFHETVMCFVTPPSSVDVELGGNFNSCVSLVRNDFTQGKVLSPPTLLLPARPSHLPQG